MHAYLAHDLYRAHHEELQRQARRERLVGLAVRARRRERRERRARLALHRAVESMNVDLDPVAEVAVRAGR